MGRPRGRSRLSPRAWRSRGTCDAAEDAALLALLAAGAVHAALVLVTGRRGR